jgi:D-isomer specific 2-hydroxyacid dehydrogenase, NAD binding domain
MSGANSFKFVLLPPQSDTTRDWAKRLAEIVPEARVVVAEDADTAAREIVNAEAAFGWLGSDLLLKATKLRWLQAPQAAPPAGYYYPELIAHSVVVTNFREIFNDHIGAHILAFVLAFARGLHMFIPQQFRREWKKSPSESGDVVHLPEATALIVGVGGIGSEAARLLSAFGVTVVGTDARRTTAPEDVAELHRPEALDELLPRADFVIVTVPHTPATEGFFDRARFQRLNDRRFQMVADNCRAFAGGRALRNIVDKVLSHLGIPGGPVDVEADNVLEFLRELRVVRQLERLDAMRGKLVSRKNALHRSQAHACRLRQHSAGPMGCVPRRRGKRHGRWQGGVIELAERVAEHYNRLSGRLRDSVQEAAATQATELQRNSKSACA